MFGEKSSVKTKQRIFYLNSADNNIKESKKISFTKNEIINLEHKKSIREKPNKSSPTRLYTLGNQVIKKH